MSETTFSALEGAIEELVRTGLPTERMHSAAERNLLAPPIHIGVGAEVELHFRLVD